jgi:hypothetical protein
LNAQILGLREGLEIATTAMKRAEQSKLRRSAERARAEENYRLAAAGLADLRAGLEELHRRADAHRTVMRRLEEARAALGIQVISVEDIGKRFVLAACLDASSCATIWLTDVCKR